MLKNKLIEIISQELDSKIEALKSSIEAIAESQGNETKSSAGDKYETGREMMQIELDKNREQLAKTIKLKETILSIDTTKKYTKAEFGSIIETNNGIYFISIPFGKIKIENTEYFALSAASPIGKAFAEKAEKNIVHFQNNTYSISHIS